MPNGSTLIRRQLRAQLWGLTKISRAIRWISPVAVGVTVTRFGSSRYLESVKADKGAEKSFLSQRKSRRGQRSNKRRSRGSQPRSPHVDRPKPAERITDRKIRRADVQMTYWKDRERRIIDKLRALGRDKFYLIELDDDGKPVQWKPRLIFIACRERWHRLQSKLRNGNKWCRPFLMTWATLICSEFGYGLWEEAPPWVAYRVPGGKLREYVMACRDFQIEESYQGWEDYFQSFYPPRPSRLDKSGGKKRRVVGKPPPKPKGAPSRLPGPKGKRCLCDDAVRCPIHWR